MKAFILHDDPILATRVKAALRHTIQRAEATALWTITLRPISALRQPTTARQVLAAAVDAHLVVFASCHPESLSLWAYEWLERWAVPRRVPDAALALTDGGCETELCASPNAVVSGERVRLQNLFSSMSIRWTDKGRCPSHRRRARILCCSTSTNIQTNKTKRKET